MPDVPAGGWLLRAEVPEGIFTLAVEADDATAAGEHAAFAERCRPLLLRAAGDDRIQAERLRIELAGQLGALRGAVAAGGLGYLGALAGEHHGRPALILLGIAATPLELPGGIDPASLLTAMLRGQYPGAAVEEFPTAAGAGAGIRRCEGILLPSGAADGSPLMVEAGISQALVPFPEAGLLGTVTGFCFTPADIDLATVFTATIAHHLTIAPKSPALGRGKAAGGVLVTTWGDVEKPELRGDGQAKARPSPRQGESRRPRRHGPGRRSPGRRR